MKRLALFLLLVATFTVEASSVTISFDGSLRTSTEYQPKVSFKPAFSGYRMRKALHLLAGQIINYQIADATTFRISVKVDAPPPDTPEPLISATSKDGSNRIALLVHRKHLIIAANDFEFRSASNIVDPGLWLRLSLTVNSDTFPILLVNGKKETLRSLKTVSFAKFPEPGTLRLEPSISCRVMDLQAGKILDAEVSEKGYERLVWTARELPHFAGSQVIDSTTGTGTAWTTDPTLANETVPLPSAGKYMLSWRIKRVAAAPDGFLMFNIFEGSRLLASEKKSANALTSSGYENVNLSFTTQNSSSVRCELLSFIPIKSSIFADSMMLRNLKNDWQIQRQIELANRTMGMVKTDASAQGGKAVDNDNTLTYGPYVSIGQPGRYRATWRIKIAGSIPDRTAVLLLNVYAHDGFLTPLRRGNKSYGDLPLNTNSFTARDSWEAMSIDFQYDGADMLEFRTFTRVFHPGDVSIDTITIARISD